MCKYRGNRKARVYVLGRALIKVLQPFARRYHDASKTRRVTAMETRPRSTVHRSPKFPPNYRRTRFKRTLIGLAAVERDEISREERRSLLPPSFSLSSSPLSPVDRR